MHTFDEIVESNDLNSLIGYLRQCEWPHVMAYTTNHLCSYLAEFRFSQTKIHVVVCPMIS